LEAQYITVSVSKQ